MKQIHTVPLKAIDGPVVAGFFPSLNEAEYVELLQVVNDSLTREQVKQMIEEFAAKKGRTALVE